jgi:predicted glutamine amidotransferase
MGAPILLDDLFFRPLHSLIHQSYHADEADEPLNGDGFGVGWYVPELSPNPAVFVSTTPAWNNRNLENIATKIKSPCLFAHVRAASVGEISEANCHPFQFGKWMFMHNGSIEGFEKIKRKVQSQFSNTVYNWLRGQTDSEHFFGMLIDRILAHGDTVTMEHVMQAMKECIKMVAKLKKEVGVKAPTYLNTCITNGVYVVGTRYVDSPPGLEKTEGAPTLYYSAGRRYVCEKGVCKMLESGESNQASMVVSERLTDRAADWEKIPENHFVTLHPNHTVHLHKIDLK